MNAETRSLLFSIATTAKQITSSNPEMISYKPMVIESCKYAAARIKKLEGAKSEDHEMNLLMTLCDFPYHESLSPTVMSLAWELCQVLMERKEE